MQHERHIAAELGVRPEQVAAAVSLLDDGNTIPFIARYRKEATGTLDEEQLRHVAEQIERLRALGAVSVRKMDGIEETVKFPLPKGLKSEANGLNTDSGPTQ